MAITPNMLLNLADPTVTPGPEWAYLINLALQAIDDHDHTSDKGKSVPISAVDINQDLDMGNQTILDAKAVKLQNLTMALSGALNANKVQVINGDIWFTNAGGVPVQITSGNSIVSSVIIPSSPLMPSGTVLDFAGATPPVGFLACNGSAVSRATYSDLFSAIGTTWGVGDGVTTFNVPNLNGRTTIGPGTYIDTVSGSVTRSIGQAPGTEAHVLTLAQIPAHNHGGGNHTHAIHGLQNQGINPGNADDLEHGNTFLRNTEASGTIIATQGSGASHNNMQPSLVMLKMIKT